MEISNHESHLTHQEIENNLIQRIINWLVPVGLFFLYFFFYNFGKFTSSEMIKTTGLMAISLLSITLFVGPIGRFIPSLNILKAHRKFWGITSFLFAAIHALLVFIFYYNFNLFDLINPENAKFFGFIAGLLALIILLIITISSHKKVLHHINPHLWKAIQTTSYIALFLAVLHFNLVEQVKGVLVIKRLLGRITYWFAAIVILIRLIVILIPKKQINKEEKNYGNGGKL